MIKTETQIERDFMTFIKGSKLGDALKGRVYRAGMRPDDADTEDLIVKFLTGLDTQIQVGIVILNLYVPDINSKAAGKKVQDFKRIGVLQELINDFLLNAGGSEYWLESENTPRTMLNEEIKQHCITVKIKFKRLT